MSITESAVVDPRTLDTAALAHLSGMAAQANTGLSQASSLPVLKLNYDPESKFPRGTWVVGQKKASDGSIEDEGKEVAGLIPLAVFDRYSYYNQADTKLNCNSPFFHFGDDMSFVVGTKHGQKCGPACPYRDKSMNPHCKAQKVVFAIAVTNDGEKVECIYYASGSAYMPLMEYLEAASVVATKSGSKMPVPYFSFLAKLGSKKERNSGTTYFVPVFTQGQFVGVENIDKFMSIVDTQIKPRVESMNKAMLSPKEEPGKSSGFKGTHGVPPTTAAPSAPYVPDEEDSGPAFPSEASGMDDVPFDTGSAPASAPTAEPEYMAPSKGEPEDDWGKLIDEALKV